MFAGGHFIAYAKNNLGSGIDQQQAAFIQIVAAFVLKLHDKSKIHLGAPKKRNSEGNIIASDRRSDEIDKLKSIMNNKKQFICFLTGTGGTGKSRVIHSVKHYCKKLCETFNIEFTK